MSHREIKSQHAVDDILSSIRQIISEEDREETDSPFTAVSKDKARDSRLKDQTLELTRLVEKDGSIVNLAQAKYVASKRGIDFFKEKKDIKYDKGEKVMFQKGESPLKTEYPEGLPVFQGAAETGSQSQEKLLSEDALQESAAAFAGLARARQNPASQDNPLTADKVGDHTVDSLMRELLRPLLREWLDAHLPSIIRTLVAEQIEKALQRHKTPSP